MEIKRDIYLNKLINKKHNGLIKVVTAYVAAESLICYSICSRAICWQEEWMNSIL